VTVAFPQTPLGLRGELRIGQVWQNITTDLYTRAPITHTRGRPYRSNAADPAQCAATIRNLDGKYTPRNAESPFYGLIGRGTPFRIRVPGATPSLAVPPGHDLSGATTPDITPLDITGDLDVRVEIYLNDWQASSAPQVLMSKWAESTNQRSWIMFVYQNELWLYTSIDGTAEHQTRSTAKLGTSPSRTLALRATLDVDNGAGGKTNRFYTAPSLDGPWTLINTTTTTGTTGVFASTSPVVIGGSGTSRFTNAAGKVYRAEVRNGIDGPAVAAPNFTVQPSDTTSFTDSAGRAWTVGQGSEITGLMTRFEGEVPEWPPKWSESEQDAWTPIQAAGILRRLSQGQKTLASTLRRRIPSFQPLAYWPMEEGANAVQAYSPIPGVSPLKLTAAQWAQANTLASSAPLPTIQPTSNQVCYMLGRVPAPPNTLSSWSVRWLYRLDQANATQRTFLRIQSTGTVADWYVQSGATGSTIIAKNSDGDTLFTRNIGTGSDLFGAWIYVRLTATQSGSDVAWRVDWQDVGGDAGGFGTTYAGTVGRPTSIGSPPDGFSTDLAGMAIGHISAWASDSTAAYNGAITAWAGETAADRMIRLCGEEAVPLTVTGDITTSAPVGPQTPAPLLDLLRDCAEADGGLFGESSDRRQLTYRTRTDLYNQPAKLVLDYSSGHIAPPFEPVEDDQVRNSWEVQRAGGSSGTASLDTGPLSTQDPPAGIGVYADSATLNLATDDQAQPMANWLLHLSTWDENRYPSVTILLHKAPELIPAVMALREGDKILITGLPKQFTGSGTTELLVDGWSETLLPRTWAITFNCSPAGPWNVAAAAIVEDFEDTTYAVTIASGGNLPWVRSQVHYNTGTWSLRSGAITNNQTSDAVITVPTGATELTFAYFTSSEDAGPGFEGDRLTVLVDGVQVLRAQGITPWTSTTVNVTGASAVTFRYTKDNSSAGGEDGAWIDDLLFTLGPPPKADADSSSLATPASASATTLAVATDGPLWTTDPRDLPIDIRVAGEVMTVTAIGDRVLNANPDFETGITGWTAFGAGTLTWSTARAKGGTHSALLTTGTAVSPRFEAQQVPVTPGQQYRAAGWIYAAQAFALGITVGVNWYTASGAYLTTSTNPIVPAVGAWEYRDSTFTAPANAATGGLLVTCEGTPGTGLQLYGDLLTLGAVGQQAFTVQRSVNGVSKAQAAGTDVVLAYPTIVAL
jgi:hypothetical protein